jgi:TatD DNase family protein
MELIDSHAHIDFPQFDEDREAMLGRARAVGITTLLAIGSGPGPEKLDAAIPFAEQHDWIYATVGTHPHEAKELTPAHLEQLAKLAEHPRVIAYGEIGLDYFYDHSPRDVQERVFRGQMEIARRAKLPIIIHCRDAWPDCMNILETAWKPTGLGGILHCFTSSLEDAKRGVDMGFLISFAGNSTYPKAQNLRDVGESFDRDGLSVPCAAALPRQAQRAGLRSGSGEGPRECEKLSRRRSRDDNSGKFSPLFWSCAAGNVCGQLNAAHQEEGHRAAYRTGDF